MDPQAARAAVRSALPDLDADIAQAFALVGIAGRSRSDAALRLQLSEAELADRVYAARKALRRTVTPLTGSGWCERAERLISDRLDDALDRRGTARLDVHLRNCPRCAVHERRLVQATDALLGGLPTTRPEPPLQPRLPPTYPGPPVGPEPPSQPEAATEPAQVDQPVPSRSAKPAVPQPPDGVPAVPPTREAAAAREAPATEDAPPTPARRSLTQRAQTAGWWVLLALAVMLAVAAVALTVAGLLGAQL